MGSTAENILVVQIASGGEVVLSTAVIQALRANYPASQISCLTTVAGAEVIKNHPDLDQILTWEQQRFKRVKEDSGIFSALSLARPLLKQLKDGNFDLVVDLNNTYASAFFSFSTHAAQRIGFKDNLSSLLYTTRVVPDRELHIVDDYFNLLKQLELDIDNYQPEFEIVVKQQAKDYITRLLGKYNIKQETNVVLFNLDGRAGTWPVDKFVALGEWLAENTASRLLLVGSEDYKRRAEQITTKINAKVLNLIGQTSSDQLADLVARVDLVVSPVSEVLYFAQVANTPLVALFATSDPARLGPYQGNNVMIRSRTDKIEDISVKSVINHLNLVNPKL